MASALPWGGRGRPFKSGRPDQDHPFPTSCLSPEWAAGFFVGMGVRPGRPAPQAASPTAAALGVPAGPGASRPTYTCHESPRVRAQCERSGGLPGGHDGGFLWANNARSTSSERSAKSDGPPAAMPIRSATRAYSDGACSASSSSRPKRSIASRTMADLGRPVRWESRRRMDSVFASRRTLVGKPLTALHYVLREAYYIAATRVADGAARQARADTASPHQRAKDPVRTLPSGASSAVLAPPRRSGGRAWPPVPPRAARRPRARPAPPREAVFRR